MNAQEFIDGITQCVINDSVIIAMENLTQPLGRLASQAETEASAWFLGLSSEGQTFVADIIQRVAHSAAFGFCCVLDGDRVIEPIGEKSEFRLVCVSPDGTEIILNPPDGEMLHDILNAR